MSDQEIENSTNEKRTNKPVKNKSEYQNFLINRHEKIFNTPHQVLNAAVLKATGSSIFHKDRIIKGEANEVYDIKTENLQEIIIRIAHKDETKERFHKEKWVLEECGKNGIPVPKVLYLENLIHNNQHLSICVENKLKGIPLNDMLDMSDHGLDAKLTDLIQKSGGVLAKIHSVKTNGFGDLNASGENESNSIEVILDDKYLQKDKMLEITGKVNLDAKFMFRAIEIFRSEISKYKISKASLIHGDFLPKHILIDGDKISGIIDFESAKGGDPIMDFAHWYLLASKDYAPEVLEILKTGYTDKSLFDADFESRLAMWKIYNSIKFLSICDRRNNNVGINYFREKLINSIDYFK